MDENEPDIYVKIPQGYPKIKTQKETHETQKQKEKKYNIHTCALCDTI
jgi:hypothetical protein